MRSNTQPKHVDPLQPSRALKKDNFNFLINVTLNTPTLSPHQLFSPSMTMHGTNGYSPDNPTRTRQLESMRPPSSVSSRHTRLEEATPTRPPYSPAVTQDGSSFRSELTSSPTIPQDVNGSDVNTPESHNEWSSAVGRATVGGKSGRVIEKLMGDVERMRRDNRLLMAEKEEEVRRSESARSLVESLRTTNTNLSAICEANNSALARKDRKIEELKTELEAEKARRVDAEKQAKAVSKERDEVVAVCKKELMAEKEIVRKSSSQYEALASSWRGLDDGYRRQTQKLKDDIKIIHNGRVEDQHRYDQLDVIFTQLSREAKSYKEAKDHVVAQFEKYKQEKESGLQEMREQAEKNNLASEETLMELKKVIGQMKYVTNVKRNVKGAE